MVTGHAPHKRRRHQAGSRVIPAGYWWFLAGWAGSRLFFLLIDALMDHCMEGVKHD
jgi:hypothetical protein